MAGLEDVAQALYAVPPSEFVAARTALAREAGARELAEAVRGLGKPTTAAWAVNMLVRHQPELMAQVLDLGSSLRTAQANLAGDDLRALSRQRRQLTAAVTAQGRSLAGELGQRLGDAVAQQVEDTLHAAMVDEVAAAAVRTGLLLRSLTASGVGTVDIEGALALPEAIGTVAVAAADPVAVPEAAPTLSVVPDDTRVREAAAQALAEADAGVEIAEKKLAKATRRVRRLEARQLQVQAELEELRRAVAEAEHRLERVDDGLGEAEDRRAAAHERREAAVAERDTARQRLEDLD